ITSKSLEKGVESKEERSIRAVPDPCGTICAFKVTPATRVKYQNFGQNSQFSRYTITDPVNVSIPDINLNIMSLSGGDSISDVSGTEVGIARTTCSGDVLPSLIFYNQQISTEACDITFTPSFRYPPDE